MSMSESHATSDAVWQKVPCSLCGSTRDVPLHTITAFDRPFNIVRCANCGMVYMNPMFTEEALASLYREGYYRKTTRYSYFDERENEQRVIKAAQRRLRRMNRMVDLRQGTLLDVGCAFGVCLRTAKHLYPQCHVHGVDISEYATEYARDQLGLDVLTGSLEEAAYPSNLFDAVTMTGLIEHLRDPRVEMREVNRVMRMGGVVVIETGDVGSLEARIKGKHYTYFLPGHVNYFSRRTLRRLLEETGFTVLRMFSTDYGFLNYSLLKMAKRGSGSVGSLLGQVALALIGGLHCGNLAIAGRAVCYAKKTLES
jgi:ubiquinone/menaquinone biosynthesis C-methylase UbiE